MAYKFKPKKYQALEENYRALDLRSWANYGHKFSDLSPQEREAVSKELIKQKRYHKL